MSSPVKSANGSANKRKASSPPPAEEEDSRFTSFLSQQSTSNQEQEAPSPKASDDADLDALSSFPKQKPLPSHLLPKHHSSSTSSSSNTKKTKQPGLIYLSRIPPGMGPGKVKHLLSQFGEVGRIYLARADSGKEVSLKKRFKEQERHQSHNFKEGWIEFMDKRVARSVADMLNAQNIGGKKSDRWHDDVWTMKYLPRFRWDQLSEQVALERATQTSLMRFHLTNSKQEQESYLSQVEKHRVSSRITDKAASRAQGKKSEKVEAAKVGEGEEKEGKNKRKKREFKQRQAVEKGGNAGGEGGDEESRGERKGSRKELENVLGRLF